MLVATEKSSAKTRATAKPFETGSKRLDTIERVLRKVVGGDYDRIAAEAEAEEKAAGR